MTNNVFLHNNHQMIQPSNEVRRLEFEEQTLSNQFMSRIVNQTLSNQELSIKLCHCQELSIKLCHH